MQCKLEDSGEMNQYCNSGALVFVVRAVSVVDRTECLASRAGQKAGGKWEEEEIVES